MNPEENFSQPVEDRKLKLKEKRELKKLQMFQYEPKENVFRESTRKMKEGHFYKNIIRGKLHETTTKNEKETEEDIFLKKKKGKKRGRKAKKKNSEDTDAENEEFKNGKKKRGRKKKSHLQKTSNQNLNKSSTSSGRILNMSNFAIDENEMNSDLLQMNSTHSLKNIFLEKNKNIILKNNFDELNLNELTNGGQEIDNNYEESFISENNSKHLKNKNIISVDLINSQILTKHSENSTKISISNNFNINNSYGANFNLGGVSVFNSEINKLPVTNNIKNNLIIDENKFYNESEIIREKVKKFYPSEVEKYFMQAKMKNSEEENKTRDKDDNNLNNFNSVELKSKTFINCDLRFFNFDMITSRIGHFDVVMIDPPWRIKGGQRNDSSFMFSNSKFNLEYNTLSNNEIISLPVEKLSKKGFCFLWILNSLMNVGYECLNKWGYDVVDQITWVKTRNEKMYISQGYYFLHSSEVCLVGYKCSPNERVEYKSKVASNIMFGNVRGKSQKPEEIYELIDKMMPGSKKVELFARNNNLREGWLSLGNQLGENYHQWKNILTCDNCKSLIDIGVKRYKSKKVANYDICQKCYENFFKNKNSFQNAEPNLNLNLEQNTNNNNSQNNLNTELTLNNHITSSFFEFKNNIDEDILHHYICCNNCNSEPIWGNRFTCTTCHNFDLCEACFDTEMTNESNKENPHVLVHEFKCFEVAELANGLAAHNDLRCKFCYMKPIIGPCFECIDCKNYTVCQNCYFNSSFVDDKHFNINSEHKLNINMRTKNKLAKYVKCFGCSKEPIEKIRYKCNECHSFDLCENCYKDRAKKEFLASSHKNYHTFTAFYL